MIKNNYEVIINFSREKDSQADILASLLINYGIKSEYVVETVDRKESTLSAYVSLESRAKKLKSYLSKFNVPANRILIRKVIDKNWKNKWKEDFKIFKLTERFDVVPIWEKKQYKNKKREPIFIDTSLAFGTGLHETTSFMAKLIERCSGKFDSFLDIGTGTGILAIIAQKCSASHVAAFDVDKDAVNVARENLKNNNCQINELNVANVLDVDLGQKYDFVAANLTTRDLIKHSRKIVSLIKKGMYLAVSGISYQNEKLFREKFSKLPIRCIKIEKGKEWLAFLFKRI